jgi:hypothetical protein
MKIQLRRNRVSAVAWLDANAYLAHLYNKARSLGLEIPLMEPNWRFVL